MKIEDMDVIPLTRKQIERIAELAAENGASRFYVAEDGGGNLRFGALEEIPAHYRRRSIPLTGGKP